MALISGGGGGGSSPSPEPFNYFGSITGASSPVTVPSGGGGALANWVQAAANFHPGQAASFFNLADPTNPVVLAAGNYSFDLEANATQAKASGRYLATLYLDVAGMDDGPGGGIPLANTESTIIYVGCRRFLAAGTVIQFFLYQTSGTNLAVDTWMQVSKEATS